MRHVNEVATETLQPGGLSRRQTIGSAMFAAAGFGMSPPLPAAYRGSAPLPSLPGAGPAMSPMAKLDLQRGQAAWGQFSRRFVSPEGRVVDTGNGGISHSEGQGVGLLSAALFGDQATFDRMLTWTQEKLSRPFDSLHSWRYRPGDANPVSDQNNATDGDLLITLALFTGADRWQEARYHKAALALTHDILNALVRFAGDRTLLMPAIQGFDKIDGFVVNPSYYVFPALKRLAAEMPDPRWDKLWADGIGMFRAARFGSYNLPADWVSVSRDGRNLALANAWPARYSFDAVRLPLYMCWAGLHSEPSVASADTFWSHCGGQAAPAWTDLKSGANAPYCLSPGMDAIRRLVRARLTGDVRNLEIPPVAAATDYYAAALILLVHAAVTQSDVLES